MKPTFKQYLISEAKKISTHFPEHKNLNQKVWSGNELRPEVKEALVKIAKEFEEFLDSPDIKITDIIFTGSLANYNYTRYSDIDLHLIVDASSSDNEDCKVDLEEFFMTKKNLWNQTHDIEVHGFPVELYAQLADEDVTAEGVYSIMNDEWVHEPKPTSKNYDKYAVEVKAKYFINMIQKAIDDKVDDRNYLKKIMEKIKNMRKSGLEKNGEFSEENLAFKVLRNTGYLEKLSNYRSKLKDEELSL